MKNIFFVLFLIAFTTGCQKPNDTPRTEAAHQFGALNGSCYDYTSATYTAATNCPGLNTASAYTMQNGTCVSTSTGQPAAATNCTTSSTKYYTNNGTCYSSSTNQQVATSFCSTNPPSTGGPCYGNYIYNGNGYPEYGYCYGTNCRGYVLVEVATGRTVNCQ